MPKYSFKLVDATTVVDQGEQSFEKEKQAAAAATGMAHDLLVVRAELRDRGFKILVTDETGEEIFLAPLDLLKPF